MARAQFRSNVQFHIIDITSFDPSLLSCYDIGIDKGTLDTILLCSSDQRKAKCEAYVDAVHRHIKHFLILISCNWTRTELLEFFQPSKSLFVCFFFFIIHKNKFILLEFLLFREIETPTLSFSGQQGRTVTFLVLQKQKKRK